MKSATPLSRIFPVVFSLTVFFLFLEVALRILPVAIPLSLLEQFEPEMRSHIADRRKLTTRKDTVLLERRDGGPPDRMWVYAPATQVHQEFDEPHIVKTVTVDDEGFCNTPSDLYQTDTFDIVTIGDSFTFCWTVAPNESWSAYLARFTGSSVYNLGLPGRGLYEYLELLRHYGLSKAPRIVVMNVYAGNDFRDAYLYFESKARSADSVARHTCPFASEAACRTFVRLRHGSLGRNSYAYNFLAAAIWTITASANKSEIRFQYDVRLADGSTLKMNSRNGDRDEVEFAQRLVDGRLSTEMFDAALEDFARLADQHDFFPVVSYTPSAYTAYDSMATFDDEGIADTMSSYSDLLRAYFARKTSELDLAFVDLTPVLVEEAATSVDDSLLYFRTNVHFTPRGHRVAAREIHALLNDRGLLAETSGGTSPP